MIDDLFTFAGTLSRMEYFLKTLKLYVITFILAFLFSFSTGLFGINNQITLFGVIGIILLSFLSYFSIACRRLHDIGFSGWWYIFPFLAPYAVYIYAWITNGASLDMNGLVSLLTDPAAFIANIERFVTTVSLNAGGVSFALNIFAGVFYLCLLFVPSKTTNNKYDGSIETYHHHESLTQQTAASYLALLKDPVDEESVYVIPHLKKELKGIKKIKMPNDRTSMTIDVANNKIKPKHIKKLLHKNGFFTTSIKKILE